MFCEQEWSLFLFDIRGPFGIQKKIYCGHTGHPVFPVAVFLSDCPVIWNSICVCRSFITATFKVRFQKKCTVRSPVQSFFVGNRWAFAYWPFFATLNLCIMYSFLNIAVPFMLIYLQTTQFNQKGYFTNAMEFFPAAARPVGWEGFLPRWRNAVRFGSIVRRACGFTIIFHRKP